MSMKLVVEDETIPGKQVKVTGILYLEEIAEGGTDTETGTDGDSTYTPPTDTPVESEDPTTETEVPQEPLPESKYQCDGNTEVIGYGEIRTLLNVRLGNSSDAPRITTYRKDTIVEILEFCANEWLRIVCKESGTGYAYVCNVDDVYVTVGRGIYTVQDGDTIKTVAQKTLGSASRYEEIKRLNGMKDNVIAEGLVLLIP